MHMANTDMSLMKTLSVLAAISAFALAAAAHAQFDHLHASWGVLLKRHVVPVDGGKASQLRYVGMAADRAELKSYLSSLSGVSETEFRGWSKDQQLAFLINAYNAHMIELVLTRHPNIKSVWDFGKLFNNPFKNRFFTLFGKAFSLDNIEHDMIRANGVYNDPRIHFAVNCASIGCPMLRDEPYTASKLEQQLEDQTTRFLSDRSRNRYNSVTRMLEVSKIFSSPPWYGGDFSRGWKGYRSPESFFAKYAYLLADQPDEQKVVTELQAGIRHLDYDWDLNDTKR